MPKYCVNRNAQANGDHEVHKEGCSWWPSIGNDLDLGYCSDCFEAVAKAKKIYSQTNGCAHCSSACHTS